MERDGLAGKTDVERCVYLQHQGLFAERRKNLRKVGKDVDVKIAAKGRDCRGCIGVVEQDNPVFFGRRPDSRNQDALDNLFANTLEEDTTLLFTIIS